MSMMGIPSSAQELESWQPGWLQQNVFGMQPESGGQAPFYQGPLTQQQSQQAQQQRRQQLDQVQQQGDRLTNEILGPSF